MISPDGQATSVYDRTLVIFTGVSTSRVEINLDAARRQIVRSPGPRYADRIAALEDLLAQRYARFGRPKSLRKRPRRCRPPARWLPAIDRICDKHHVSRKELFSGYKDDRIVDCRHEVWWTIRAEFGASLSAIGRRLGGYHHTSVMHGVRKWQARVEA